MGETEDEDKSELRGRRLALARQTLEAILESGEAMKGRNGGALCVVGGVGISNGGDEREGLNQVVCVCEVGERRKWGTPEEKDKRPSSYSEILMLLPALCCPCRV